MKKSLFHKYKEEANLEKWDGFPEFMWELGFEMDCENSFNDYKENCNLTISEANCRRDEYKNKLYILENADANIVGNYLFSIWRYWTHWAYSSYDEYELDFIRRIIDILENKLSNSN